MQCYKKYETPKKPAAQAVYFFYLKKFKKNDEKMHFLEDT